MTDADAAETFLRLPCPSGPTVEMDGTAWLTEELVLSLAEADDLAWPDPTTDFVFDQAGPDLAPRGGRCAGNVGTVREGGRLVLSPCDIPYHTPPENLEWTALTIKNAHSLPPEQNGSFAAAIDDIIHS